MQEIISGIQQVGIGVADAQEAKLVYKTLFGMNVLVFDDKAEAALMSAYTGQMVHNRRAILSLNMCGGGGFEIWQFTSRTPSKPPHPPLPGDLGIFAVKIKARNVQSAHHYFSHLPNVTLSGIYDSPDNRKHFWLLDCYGNHFNIVEGDEWFKPGCEICGGVSGAVIGVSNMDRALHFYKELLGIHEVVYDQTASINDLPDAAVTGQPFRRVLLKKQVAVHGAFSKLLGAVQIELIEAKGRTPRKIYADRFWGDCGFIHLCLDVLHMNQLKCNMHNVGYQFTVDSADSFAMGDSAGRFCYVEDPDGTLIELVETHKVPLLKKFGLYLNLKNRKDNKPLPNWMIGMLALNKIR